MQYQVFTSRDRCNTIYNENRSSSFVMPTNLNQQLLIQNQKLQNVCGQLESEVKRLEYHLSLSNQNLSQLRQIYEADQIQMQQMNTLIQFNQDQQTRILDLEQENYHLYQQVEHLQKNQLSQEELENQVSGLKQEQEKLLKLSREIVEEVQNLQHNPLLEVLEKFRERIEKSYSISSVNMSTKERYSQLARLSMRAAELMSFKLNYK